MEKPFTFTVNGESRTVTTDPERLLLEVLREDLGLTGTKYGCGEGQCRACTVLLDGEPNLSCMTRIAQVQGRNIVTIEGIGKPGQLHPVQKAFLEAGAFQCGYCTPGMILGTVALLKEKPRATDQEISAGLQRHLCRCCNYPQIVTAVRQAVASQTA